MKKLIALVICAMMVLTMIPAMALTASAAVEGEFFTTRGPGAYPETPEEIEEDARGEFSYKPASGYKYDSEGFHTISPDFTSLTPYVYIARRDADNLQEGLSLELRVDEYAYAGESGTRDQWISFALWDQQLMSPGGTEDGSGWLCLIRGAGTGSANVQSFWTKAKNAEEEFPGMFQHYGDVAVKAEIDDEGKEHYFLDVTYSNGAYEIRINDTVVAGMSTVSDLMNELCPSGDFWTSVRVQTGEPATPIAMSILEFNGSVPSGDDSAEPEVNNSIIAEIASADTIPANQPCFLWDAQALCHNGKTETGYNCTLSAKGDNSYHIKGSSPQIYMQLGPNRQTSYAADDFPVVCMMLRNYWGTDGTFWYCAGDVMGAQNDCVTGWSLYDDTTKTYGANDEYCLVMVDLSDMWWGRIHSVRLVFEGLTPDDPEYGEFDLMWWGCFRSVDEATAYGDAFMAGQDVGTKAPETEAPATEAPVVTEAPKDETKAPVNDETKAPVDGTTADSSNVTEASKSDDGCASVIGGAVAVLASAMVAAVALKKKH